MNRLLIGLGIGLLLGLSCCYVVMRFYPIGYAKVTIRNQSGKHVKEVVLEHEKGKIQASGLSADEELQFAFENTGENAYHVTVTLNDDRVLTSNPVYIETGYRGTEIITDSEIRTENNW